MYTVDYSVKPLLGREWAIEFLPKKTSKSFFHSDTQVCCLATGNPLIASSTMHWVCYPRRLRGQRSRAYLISSIDVWYTLPAVKGSLLMSDRVERDESS